MDRDEREATGSPPVVFGPGWQVPTSAGVRQVTLQPEPVGGWAQVDVGGRLQTPTWTTVDELGDRATAPLDGLGQTASLEARRVVSDFSSFMRGPRFRGALWRSIGLGLLGMLLGIAIAVVWRMLDLPAAPSTVIAVFLTFALASIPFRGTNAVHTEYRLLLEGEPRGSMLVAQVGRSTKVTLSTPSALADASHAQPPAWPSDRGPIVVAEPSGEGVLAQLVARKTDSGMLGVWSSELWLLPDGLLSVGTGIVGSVAMNTAPVMPVARRLSPGEIGEMAALPRSQRIPWTSVGAATLKRGLIYDSLTLLFRDGGKRRFIWGKGTGNLALLAQAARVALGSRFEDRT